MTALVEVISEARGALGVGVEVLIEPTMLVQRPDGNDGLPTDVGVLYALPRYPRLKTCYVCRGYFQFVWRF
jgi:hypothetical protein